jgi:hypothetical protein
VRLASGIPGNRLDNIGRAWRNSRIPDVRRLLVSSTVSFMLNHASWDLWKLADDQREIGVRKECKFLYVNPVLVRRHFTVNS